MNHSLTKPVFAEAIGTAMLLAIVIGSGIMGDALSKDDGIALLGNTIATGAGLVILIQIFGPISGAHFNPAVTLSFLIQRKLKLRVAAAYVSAQILGGIIGVYIAHGMFELNLFQFSTTERGTEGEFFGEFIATFSLLMTIIMISHRKPDAVPYAVGLVITAGYWFTSSTSFANPAVTLARTLTDTFAGIAPGNAPYFIAAQLIGAVVATATAIWLLTPSSNSET